MSICQKVQMTAVERVSFKEFEATTGGDGHGLEDLVDGRMSFAEAAGTARRAIEWKPKMQ